MSQPFPLYLPPDAPRLFQTESLLRRLAQSAGWDTSSRLLELYASLGGLALSRALNCAVVVVDPEQRPLDSTRERARIAGVLEKVTFLKGPALEAGQGGGFQGIFTFSHVLGTPGAVARHFRPRLAERGRLAYPFWVKVGRTAVPEVLAAWERRLGAPLKLPREALLEVEAEGFEPELLEAVGEAELTEYVRELEVQLKKVAEPAAPGPAGLAEELALYRAHQGQTGVTLAFVVARRKEPGEKPPLSRDSG
jgi:hypothetical protein